MKRFGTILITVLIHLCPAFAQHGTGESNIVLDTVTVNAVKSTQSVVTMSDGNMELNMELMDALPKIMGNSDPVSFSKLLPGVQTTAEGNGSLHINGSDNGHNMISVLDVPLYNVNHLLGLFLGNWCTAVLIITCRVCLLYTGLSSLYLKVCFYFESVLRQDRDA